MRAVRRSVAGLVMLVVLGVSGCGLWLVHASAWSLGRRSPVLGEGALHALAARELAHGARLGTSFAVPLTLVRHSRPPWPLEGVEPGMVALEAATFLMAAPGEGTRPDRLEWWILPIPFTAYLLLGMVAALGALKILLRHPPPVGGGPAALVAGVIGLGLLLDPESQHLAAGGAAALPFTLGLVGATATLALGLASRRPFRFGLIVGAALLFRSGAAWLGPLMAAAAAASAEPGRRRAALIATLLGCAVPLAPWWVLQTLTLGSPFGEHFGIAMWDGVQMRSLFAMLHVAAAPDLPGGAGAFLLLAGKTLANLPAILLRLTVGLGALQIGALAIVALDRATSRPLRAAAGAALAAVAGFAVDAALTTVEPGSLHGARMLLVSAGTLAAVGLAARLPALAGGAPLAAPARALLLTLALAWGGWQTARGAREARAASAVRGTPTTLTLLQVSVLLSREVRSGQPVASNLGALLAWHGRRPVVHLPLAPEDLEACRERLDLEHVILVFRGPSEAWPGWEEIVARPREAMDRPELNAHRVRAFRSADGFTIVWLELGPPAPRLASGVPAGP